MSDAARRAFAITMVYQDDFFLDIWYRYYGAQLGHENLYIVAHGAQPSIAVIAPRANIITIPREDLDNIERRRWIMLSHFAGALLTQYYCGVVTDVDEMVVVDPLSGKNLFEFITEFDNRDALFPMGMELFQMLGQDQPLDPEKPILHQRRNAFFTHNYTKANIIYRFAQFINGAHGIYTPNAEIAEGLLMLHLKYCNSEQILARRSIRQQIVEDTGAFGKGSAWVRESGADFTRLLRKMAARKLVNFDEARNGFRQKIGFIPKADRARTKRVFTSTRFELPERFIDMF